MVFLFLISIPNFGAFTKDIDWSEKGDSFTIYMCVGGKATIANDIWYRFYIKKNARGPLWCLHVQKKIQLWTPAATFWRFFI